MLVPKQRFDYLEEVGHAASPVARPRRVPAPDAPAIEVSVVMPCLDEADTLATCIRKAQAAMEEAGIVGEVVVADNGSGDGSQRIAEQLGARVVQVARRGYGAALMGGVAETRGRYIVMGDADDSYDFRELPRLVAELRKGADLAQGCRLESGGGRVMPGAMRPLHRWVGNPLFSALARWWFRAPVHDIYCGFRAFTRGFYDRLDPRCTGMEFATEMVIKGALQRARIHEVPITFRPDGRSSHGSHLRTFHDGWRTLRFFLLCRPFWLFVLPGLVLSAVGLLGYSLALPGARLGPAGLGGHTLLVASLALISGYQALLFAAFSRAFAVTEHLVPTEGWATRLHESPVLDRGLLLGHLAMIAGVALLAWTTFDWWTIGFGELDYSRELRRVIPGMTLATLGFQTVLGSFFLGVLGMSRR